MAVNRSALGFARYNIWFIEVPCSIFLIVPSCITSDLSQPFKQSFWSFLFCFYFLQEGPKPRHVGRKMHWLICREKNNSWPFSLLLGLFSFTLNKTANNGSSCFLLSQMQFSGQWDLTHVVVCLAVPSSVPPPRLSKPHSALSHSPIFPSLSPVEEWGRELETQKAKVGGWDNNLLETSMK